MTTYMILKEQEDGDWKAVATAEASSAGRAISAGLDKGGGAGSYLAIPKRSWKPLTVKVEQTTKVTIG